MNYFNQCRTLREVKQKFKDLAMKHHPDRGGHNKTMQAINLEYSLIINNPFFNFSGQSESEKEAYIKFPEIIGKIINLELIIEICGQWIWISGNTYKYREYLKNNGFYFAKNKQVWYWRPADQGSTNRKPISMDRIRSLYGSDTVKTQQTPRLQKEKESAV